MKDEEEDQRVYERMPQLRKILTGRFIGNVLEIGIGRGEFGNVVLEANKQIVSYLGSDDFVGELKKASGRFARYICLPDKQAIKDRSVRTVVLANMLHHTKNPGKVIEEALSLLQDQNGLLTICEQVDDCLSTAETNHRDYHHWTGSIDRERGLVHNKIFTGEQLEALVLEHNLECFESHVIHEEKDKLIDDTELSILHTCMQERLRTIAGNPKYQIYEEEASQIIKRIQCSGILRTRQLLMFLRRGK